MGITFKTSMEDTTAVIFDDNIAPKGYAYLIVNQNCGTMAAVLYRDFKKGNECLKRMIRFFRDNMGVDIKNEKKFGGFGNFFLRDTQIHEDKLYIGEAAGFQDGLWGFGMKYAILSGSLAAKSMINGSDYNMLWKRDLKPMIETSFVNRYLFEKVGHAGYRYLAKKFTAGSPCDFLRRHYNPSPLKQLLRPIVSRKYKF
ncbi:MAG TPA: hypothetical protein ENH01_10790 [Nitrospirae bacterium]|nr:hypothetical protein [Nitrospirota bacterium]